MYALRPPSEIDAAWVLLLKLFSYISSNLKDDW